MTVPLAGMPLWHQAAILFSTGAAVVAVIALARYGRHEHTSRVRTLFWSSGAVALFLMLSNIAGAMFMAGTPGTASYRFYMQLFHLFIGMTGLSLLVLVWEAHRFTAMFGVVGSKAEAALEQKE